MDRGYRRRKSRKVNLLLGTAAMILAAAVLFLSIGWEKEKNTSQALLSEKQRLQQETQRLQSEIEELTVPRGGVEEYGRLSVKGTQLCDRHGDPIQLRGLSSHGLAWYPEYTNYRALKTLKEYGANAFRIAMYVEQNDGYLEEPELNRKLLYAAIENSLAADLYTIVDWHVLRDEDPNRHASEAIAELKEVAKRYGDEPGIIYEICNEPNGDTSYEDIAEYATKVIPAIRKYAPDALILVGTPDFCTSLTEAMEDPLPYDNVMYTYHYYAGISDGSYAVKELREAREQGLAVFISEWGLDRYDTDQKHWEATGEFLDFLEQEKISWINWSLSNKDEGYSMIRPGSKKLHGWNGDDLTDTGRFILPYLLPESR